MKSALGQPAVLSALGAAVLFGASTPLAKQFTGDLPPLLLAGLLYLGSGVGLTALRLIRDCGWESSRLRPNEWPWLSGAIFFGGVLGPVLLMSGLRETMASTASLLLNLEGVLTALLAWLAFRENTDRRIVFGMVLIVAGGLVLSWSSGATGQRGWAGPSAIAAACLCWAIDNNLTRKVSAADSVFLGAAKGLAAGTVNTVLALLFTPASVAWHAAVAAMLVGFLGYGVSVVLFVLALRGLGAARTGAYFSTAPFIGAAIAIALFAEPASTSFWVAAALMGLGVWLHITERHAHEHTHTPLEHSHSHVHDEHHRHEHDFKWDGKEPHAHSHRHQPLTHTHPHFPDVHHEHRH
ncbi:MAG TPA: DMT family transporter [Burkholderiaceae bacterium]|nr:DMT family transporter [Burkholderiaceae bacterium]